LPQILVGQAPILLFVQQPIEKAPLLFLLWGEFSLPPPCLVTAPEYLHCLQHPNVDIRPVSDRLEFIPRFFQGQVDLPSIRLGGFYYRLRQKTTTPDRFCQETLQDLILQLFEQVHGG
jgi:hypothetical protein